MQDFKKLYAWQKSHALVLRPFAQFLKIALGSAGELEYYAILAADLQLIPSGVKSSFEVEIAEAKKVITGLLKAVVANDRN